MARPTKAKRICGLPARDQFGPLNCQAGEWVTMTLEEYEAIRLIDLMDCTQEECAAQMRVARTTVQAVYNQARKKLAEVLVHGKRLRIDGGSYEICPRSAGCCKKSFADCHCRKRRCDKENISDGGSRNEDCGNL